MRCHQAISPIAQTPSNVFVRKILSYTLKLLSDAQRAQFIGAVLPENVAQSDILLRLDCTVVNGELSKLEQFAEQFVNRITECFTKLNPRSEPVSNAECVELVCGGNLKQSTVLDAESPSK